MIYLFETEAGEVVERWFTMDEAPEIGSSIEDPDNPGHSIRRLVSLAPGMSPVKEYRHVAHSLPRVDPRDPYWPHFDERNKPVCTSKAQVQELQARMGHRYRWDQD